MGSVSHLLGIQDPFPPSTTSVGKPSFRSFLETLQERSLPHRGGDHSSAVQTGYRRSITCFVRVSFPALYHTEKDQGPQTSAEPASSEPVRSQQALPDGVTQNRLHAHQPGRLPYQYPPGGRLPARVDAPIFSPLPPIYLGGKLFQFRVLPFGLSAIVTNRFRLNVSATELILCRNTNMNISVLKVDEYLTSQVCPVCDRRDLEHLHERRNIDGSSGAKIDALFKCRN